MKLKKKSGLMGAVIALSAASLVSVGFASWVISQGDTEQVTGAFVADEVDNQVHELTLTWVDKDGEPVSYANNKASVIFGRPAAEDIEEGITNPWLTNDNGPVESLVFYLKVECTNVKATDTIASVIEEDPTVVADGLGGTIGEGNDAKTGYAGALADGLVKALPTAQKTASTWGESKSFVYTITFEWGVTFGGKNPYNYYNKLTNVTPEQQNAAATALANLKTYLTGEGFSITVVAK